MSTSPGDCGRPGLSRVVLDTNVWLDWLVFDDRSIAPLKAAVAGGRIEIYIDGPCLAELERVLGYPLLGLPLDAATQAAHRAACLGIARVLHERARMTAGGARAPLPVCSDPDDQKFLELARDCAAHALLTKDRALLALSRRKSRPTLFQIVTPQAYTL